MTSFEEGRYNDRMAKTGILLHVYTLGSKDWDRLVWGDPTADRLGTATKLVELLLHEPIINEIMPILFDGPTFRNGQSEGVYTKTFLLSKLGELRQFPRLKARLDVQTAEESHIFQRRLEAIKVVDRIDNTFDEIVQATKTFAQFGADKVIHIAAPSHAPRCIQLQSVARERGLIPDGQLWLTAASDIPFAGSLAQDTVVIEMPHRVDDPLVGYEPTLASVIKPYFSLTGDQQKQFIQDAQHTMAALRPQVHGDGREGK